jgi:hypothetical protein
MFKTAGLRDSAWLKRALKVRIRGKKNRLEGIS